MHIKGVASRRAGRPTRTGQCLTADHGTEAIQQGLEQSGLHGRQRHPVGPATQHPVMVEDGPLGAMAGTSGQDGGAAGIDIDLTGRQTHPVLEAIEEGGWSFLGVDHEQTGNPLGSQERTTFGIAGQGEKGNIHGGETTVALFPDCFVDVKA